MRLTGFFQPIAFRVRSARWSVLSLLGLCALAGGAVRATAQQEISMTDGRMRAHDSAQWRQVQEHLPDPKTATPQALEQQADILRARRFP
jgi:hypothetical protein